MAAMVRQNYLQATVHQRSVTRDGVDSATLYVCDVSNQSKDKEYKLYLIRSRFFFALTLIQNIIHIN